MRFHGIETRDISTRNYSIYSNRSYNNTDEHGFNLHALNGEVAGNISTGNRFASKFYDARDVWVHHNIFENNSDWSNRVGIGSSLGRTPQNLRFYKNKFIPGGGITFNGSSPASEHIGFYIFDNGVISVNNSKNVQYDDCISTDDPVCIPASYRSISGESSDPINIVKPPIESGSSLDNLVSVIHSYLKGDPDVTILDILNLFKIYLSN